MLGCGSHGLDYSSVCLLELSTIFEMSRPKAHGLLACMVDPSLDHRSARLPPNPSLAPAHERA